MSKTYTFTLSQGGFVGGRNSGTFSYSPAFSLYEGYYRLGTASNNGTAYGWQYCINAPFTPNIVGSATSVKLKITHSSANYNTHIRVAKKNAAGTSSFTYTDIAESYAAKSATTTTIDLTSTGVPTYGYILYSDSSSYANTYVTVSKVELTIVTDASDFTVTYDANGGSEAPASQTFTVVSGGTATLSSIIPIKTGYEFLGWSTDSTATSATYTAGSSIALTANITLYAVWQSLTSARDVTLSYDIGEGNGTITSQTIANSTEYELSFVISSVQPTHSTLIFGGWLAPDGIIYASGDTITIRESTTLVAQYLAAGIKVTFDPNGGICATSTKYVECMDTYGALPVATRDGYKFGGWGKWVCGGIVSETDTVLFTTDHTLHARWLPLYRTIIVEGDE